MGTIQRQGKSLVLIQIEAVQQDVGEKTAANPLSFRWLAWEYLPNTHAGNGWLSERNWELKNWTKKGKWGHFDPNQTFLHYAEKAGRCRIFPVQNCDSYLGCKMKKGELEARNQLSKHMYSFIGDPYNMITILRSVEFIP